MDIKSNISNDSSQLGNGNLTTEDSNGTTEQCEYEYCLSKEDYIDFLENYVTPQTYEWAILTVYAITFVIGLSGNFLVCFAIWRNKGMRTVTNIFIVNLAIADLTVIIICLPPTAVVDVTETWYFGFPMCKIAIFLIPVSVSVSVMTLSAISVERWYAICHPLRFKSTKKRAKIIIIVIWIISCLIALPELIAADTFRYVPEHIGDFLISCRPGWDKLVQVVFQVVLIILLYVCPLILMAFTYTMIAIVLWTGMIPGAVEAPKKPMMDNKKVSKADEQIESRRKAAKMLITVVVVFALCYFPVHLLNILRYTGTLRNGNEVFVRVFSLVSHWLPYFNSSINPIIYNFMSAKFRNEFKKVCPCFKRGRSDRIRTRNGIPTFPSTSNYAPRLTSNSCTEQILLSTYHD